MLFRKHRILSLHPLQPLNPFLNLIHEHILLFLGGESEALVREGSGGRAGVLCGEFFEFVVEDLVRG